MDAPEWFRQAIAAQPDQGEVGVDGAAIHYLAWGRPNAPGIVLVHGGAAHAHWWDHLGPLLAAPAAGLEGHRVVALDLSGHGDSGRRENYTLEQWGREALAAADAAQAGGPPVVVGHSMGGFVTVTLAAEHGHRLSAAAVIDSPVRQVDPETEAANRRGGFGTSRRVYPDLETGASRFRLVPDQPDTNAWLVDHVARHSLRHDPDGWTWKFDPGVFGRREVGRDTHERLPVAATRTRLALLRGQYSALVTDPVAREMSHLAGLTVPFVDIPQGHHHVLLDQPLALLAVLRTLLAVWATPHRT